MNEIEEAEVAEDEIIVLSPEELGAATSEEREAYFQYLVQTVKRVDEWESWLQLILPQFANKPFSKGHKVFWEWVWSVNETDKPDAFVAIFSRGHGKSSMAEMAVTALAARGKRRYGLYVCHEKGTLIFDPDTGSWMPVEDHPTATRRHCDGLEVKLSGLPYVETVTHEHRYWGRRIARRDMGRGKPVRFLKTSPHWIEAQHLDWNTWIGHPIDMEVADPPVTLQRYNRHTQLYEEEVCKRFDDPDWWWVMGLWWGDGTLGASKNGMISFAMSDAHPEVKEKLFKILDRHDIKYNDRHHKTAAVSNAYFCDVSMSRFLSTWKYGNSRKCPPPWVEKMPLEKQRCLVEGYIAADGHASDRGVALTSIHLPGLLSVRRMLMRLGVPCGIIQVKKACQSEIGGRMCQIQDRYRLDFREGSELFGHSHSKHSQELLDIFIEDGFMWSKIKEVEEVENREFVPIQTSTHTYLTDYGLSHNCETQDQADGHVASIAAMMESSTVGLAYPDLGKPAVNKQGNTKGWRRNRIITASGFILDACGLDSAARGIKFEDQRPDFMCHEVGTEIRDGDWSGRVEDHPGLLGFREAEGLKVSVWGIPDPEVVTKEHLYWVKSFTLADLERPAGWVESQDLTTAHYIGTPIDMDDGWLWHKVRDVSDAGVRRFAPINVGGDHTYLTDFGLSHNCYDDIDSELDGEAVTAKKIKVVTQKLLPAGAPNCAILMVQNLVHENSIFARLADGRADFLRNRQMLGPIPAVEGLEVAEIDHKWVITKGESTWPEGFPIESCQALINEFGLTAFMAECQHKTQAPNGDIFAHIDFGGIAVDIEDVPPLKRVVVWVDPSVTSNDSSDCMAIQVDGLGKEGKHDRIFRLYSWEHRMTPYAAIRHAVEKAIYYNATVVGVETNQGGDTWRVVYDQVIDHLRMEALESGGDFFKRMPRYKEAKATSDMGSKVSRAQRMLVDYERNMFRHVKGTNHTLEAALKRFPKMKPFDLVDACFVAGTPVSTSDGPVPIEMIREGDLVWTRQGLRPVVRTGPTGFDREVYELTTEDGRQIVGTEEHLVWTTEAGWTPLALAAGLTVSGRIPLSINDARPSLFVESRVATVRPLGRADVVYDISVQGVHEFMADGIVVHNCYWSWAELAGPMSRRKMKLASSARKALGSSMGIGNAPRAT